MNPHRKSQSLMPNLLDVAGEEDFDVDMRLKQWGVSKIQTRGPVIETTVRSPTSPTIESSLFCHRPVEPLDIVSPRPSSDTEQTRPTRQIPPPKRRSQRTLAPTPSPSLAAHAESFPFPISGHAPIVQTIETASGGGNQHAVSPKTADVPSPEPSSDDDLIDLTLGRLVNSLRNVQIRREERLRSKKAKTTEKNKRVKVNDKVMEGMVEKRNAGMKQPLKKERATGGQKGKSVFVRSPIRTRSKAKWSQE